MLKLIVERRLMRRRTKTAVVAGSALALAAGGAGVAAATGADDSEAPITGAALERAEAAAIDHVEGGQVTGTEVADEESYYEVEVTRSDGAQVDVQLDEDFQVVGDETDADDEVERDVGE